MTVERSRKYRSWAGWYFSGLAPFAGALAFLIRVLDSWEAGREAHPGEYVLLVVFLVLTYRSFARCLQFVEDKLVYRGYLRTVRIPVGEVWEVRRNTTSTPLLGNLVGADGTVEVVRAGGEKLVCASLYGRTRKIDPLILEIRRELKSRKRRFR